ncbi:MAG: hypothetical protein IKJ05_09020 [Oscillospiraceae bacterium]|nr:hypothetical protein [Oscillospiraceae bacterium]
MLIPLFVLTIVLAFAFALYTLADIRPSLTPLVSLVTIADIIIIFGMLGMLYSGVYVALSAAVFVTAYAVRKHKHNIKEKISGFLQPGAVMFVASCLAMLIYLAYAQPVMHEWDEFSFWGISQLLIKKHNRLYTYFTSSMLGQSIPPALPVLSYIFQWCSMDFTEWVGFFAYDVLMFACFSAFTAAFERKSANSAIFVYLLAFLVPFFFAISDFLTYMKPVYITAYSDIPMALVFAGAVAVHFFSEKGNENSVVPVLPVLMFLTFTKDMGLALGCIALFVIFFDMLVARDNFAFLKIKGFFGKCFAAFVMLITIGGSYFGWGYHLGRVLAVNRTDYGGSSGMGIVQMLLTGVKELLIGPKSDKFLFIQDSFFSAFSATKVSMIGSGRNVVLLILILFVLAFVFGDKKGKKRSATMLVSSFIGFVGYYIFHLLLYVYILGDEAYNLVSYDRYMYVYYIPWLMMAVFNLAMAARDGAKLWAKGAMAGFVCCVLLLFNFYTEPENIFTGVTGNSFQIRREIAAKADHIRDVIGREDVIYLYSGQDDGMRWFTYTFELIDNYIIPNRGISSAGATEEETKTLQQAELLKRFKDYGVTHMLMDWTSHEFCVYFNELCDVPTNDIGNAAVGYYKVVYTDDGMSFELVKGGNVSFD